MTELKPDLTEVMTRILEFLSSTHSHAPGRRRQEIRGGLSPAELGRRLGKSTRTITRRITEGLIAAKPFGRSWVIDRAEVERIDREGVGRLRSIHGIRAKLKSRKGEEGE